MDNKSIGIPNANVVWGANDPNWEYLITDAGAGLYTIELNASKLGQTTNPYTVLFSIESGFNVTQSYSVTVNVLNRTEVKIVSLQQISYSHTDAVAPYDMYYGADITVNIQLIDIDNGNAVIIGGQANLTYNSVTYYDLIDDAGTFSIIIPTSAVDVANNIPITEIAINKTGWQTSTTSTSFNIITCPTYITIDSVTVGGNGLSYNAGTDTYEGQRWGASSDIILTISYYNAKNNQKIGAATRNIDFNGASAGSGSDSSGTYQWTIGPASSHINNNTVAASFSKANYESQADTFGVWLNAIATSLTLAYPTANYSISNPSGNLYIRYIIVTILHHL
jgi:hypothetical protein